MADLTGHTIDHYRLLHWLGSGTFGEVYLGEDLAGAPVAVKVLKLHRRQETLKAFINEARTFRLKHPHIMPLLDFGVEGDTPFLVMDYAPGGTLRQRHPPGTRLSLEVILPYVKQLAAALQYAHDRKVIHRDVKPQNMLLGYTEEVLLSDFGIAVIAHDERSLKTQEHMAGTLAYMAPEQIQRKPQPASDQYALGVVVYEWLCGRRPFQGAEWEIMHQHLAVPPPSLQEQEPGLSAQVEAVVLKALAKEPKERFSTVQAFAEAFEQACQQAQHARPRVRAVATLLSSPETQDMPSNPLSLMDDLSSRSHTRSFPRPLEPVVHVLTSSRGGLKTPERFHTSRSAVEEKTPPVSPLVQKAGAPSQREQARGKSRGPWPGGKKRGLIGAGILLALLLIGGSIFASGFRGGFHPGIPSSSVIPIVPGSMIVQNTYLIAAVTSTPNAARRQVSARVLIGSAASQPLTVNATGHNQIAGARATGTLTFINGSTSPFTVAAGTILQSSAGVSVATDAPVTIPAFNTSTGFAGSATVSAHAVSVGAAGNITADAIDGTCCASGNFIRVINTAAFAGGQDPKNYNFVQRSDVNSAVSGVQSTLVQRADHSVTTQLHPGEQLAGSVQCTPKATPSGPVGDTGTNVSSITLNVTVTCTGTAYNQQGVQSLITELLQAKARSDPAEAGYVPVGNVVTQTSVQSVSNGTVSLLVNAKWLWAYQITPALEQQWAKQIAGKSVSAATAFLQGQRGVHSATIQVSGGTLPADPTEISFVVQTPESLKGNSTPPLDSPTVTAPQIS